jgi:hypothetical protein
MRSFHAGLGLETDIRSAGGQLVISHDSPGDDSLAFDWLWDHFRRDSGAQDNLLALNVKEDGLLPIVEDLLRSKGKLPEASFFFDMSVPQMVLYIRAGLPVAFRLSEYEAPISLKLFEGVAHRHLWIDGFHEDWFIGSLDVELLCETRCGIVVSPEIHGRDPRSTWDWLYEARARGIDLGICTDRPLEFLAWDH